MPKSPSKDRRVLGDLPLERYVIDESLHATKKRAHGSPSGSKPMSPHKRRILEVEGLISPSKRATPAPRTRPVDPFEGSIFSPSRRLDFGSLTLRSAPSSPAKSVLDTSDNPFSTPTQSPAPASSSSKRVHKLAPSPELTPTSCTARGSTSGPRPSPTVTRAREPSKHIVGRRLTFDGPSCQPSQASISSPMLQDSGSSSDPEDSKENVAPRRKIKKSRASAPAAPATPVTATPRPNIFSTGSFSSLNSQETPGPMRFLRRLEMQMEVDD